MIEKLKTSNPVTRSYDLVGHLCLQLECKTQLKMVSEATFHWTTKTKTNRINFENFQIIFFYVPMLENQIYTNISIMYSP